MLSGYISRREHGSKAIERRGKQSVVPGNSLSENKRSNVLALHGEGKSYREIALKINWGKDAVLRVIQSGTVRAGSRPRGMKRQTTQRSVT